MTQPPYGGQPYPPQPEYGGSGYDPNAYPQQPAYGAPQPQYPQQQPDYGQPQYPQQQYPQQQYPAQPAYGQQQYPAQPGYGQPQFPQAGFGGMPPKKSPLPWIIVGAVVVVAAIALTLVLVLNGGSSSGGASADPKAVVTTYMNAVIQGDKTTAVAQLCAAAKGQASQADLGDFGGMSGKQITFTVGDVTNQTSTTVDVPVKITYLGQSVPATFDLVKESGDWKICNAQVSGG